MPILLMGNFLDFNLETNILSLRIDFLDEEDLQKIQDAVLEQKSTKIQFNLRERKSRKYHQLKCFFGSIKLILKCLKIIPNADNMAVLREEIEKSIFPIKYTEYGDNKLPRIISLSSLSFDQLNNVITKIHSRYSYLKDVHGNPIDFSYLKDK